MGNFKYGTKLGTWEGGWECRDFCRPHGPTRSGRARSTRTSVSRDRERPWRFTWYLILSTACRISVGYCTAVSHSMRSLISTSSQLIGRLRTKQRQIEYSMCKWEPYARSPNGERERRNSSVETPPSMCSERRSVPSSMRKAYSHSYRAMVMNRSSPSTGSSVCSPMQFGRGFQLLLQQNECSA